LTKEKAKEDSLRVNEQVNGIAEVRLIDASGEAVGIVGVREALEMAREACMDLVEVSPKATPPVCKIMNYGKHLYEQQKKKQDAKKRQKIIELKEIQLRPVIDKHDLEVKMKAAEKFLGHGDKVKFVMRFRGREISHQNVGLEILDGIIETLSAVAKVETPPKLEGKQYIMILAPVSTK
jgi:translation initiation factor IF-3